MGKEETMIQNEYENKIKDTLMVKSCTDLENNMKINDDIDKSIKSLRNENTWVKTQVKKLSKIVNEEKDLKKKLRDALSVIETTKGKLEEKERVNEILQKNEIISKQKLQEKRNMIT